MNNRLSKLMKYLSIPFKELFTLTFTPSSGGTWITNAFNNWNWFSNGFAVVSQNQLYCETVGTGYNNSSVKIYRTKECFNLSRSFNFMFSFCTSGAVNTEWGSVSIGGSLANTSLYETLYGLEIRATANVNASTIIEIYNNGKLLATPYPSIGRGNIYIFVDKKGDKVSISANTTGVKPTIYDYTYTMTDKTSLSNAFIAYLCCQGFGDYGGSCSLDSIEGLLQ